MEKRHLDRRLAQMRAEGTEFRTGVDVGDDITADAAPRRVRRRRARRRRHRTRATCRSPAASSAASTRRWSTSRWSNRVQEGDLARSRRSTPHGKQVVIIGGGDTGADCLGTAHRQGAASVHQFEIMPRPPDERADATPWPTWPLIFRTSSAHEEGGERVFSVNTERFLGDDDGQRAGAAGPTRSRWSTAGSRRSRAPTSSIAVRARAPGHGLHRPRAAPAARAARRRARPTAATSPATTTGPPTSTACSSCGDMGRGQSLIVWAIAEGRAAAAAVDQHLMGETELPVAHHPRRRAHALRRPAGRALTPARRCRPR